MTDKIVDWAMRLQSLAQTGLTYGKDSFDLERYQEIRDISAEMMAEKSGLPIEKVKNLFCNEIGYQTPKIATRAAIFKDNKMLLVQESDGLWSIPGGWCEVNLSVKENVIKEIKEEAGVDITVEKLIAIHDSNKHYKGMYPYGISTVFFLCKPAGGSFKENDETIASDYFSLDDLPDLSEDKGSREQVEMCFKAYHDPYWEAEFE
ncbi:NUDIX hydrolase N-terminal domain-containing protein [Lactobacillus johnsonii]|uniref:ADP-ribose pyrophosphatase n=1 Tax=Lactobacillus johnsonii TaxID=33959 RepID=A0A9X6NYS5_LACJH|nr:NUDIX hydrolase [Lactobacillus johnsonii]OYS01420.1 ADP-ribose pyrophosphatase [Lactobacillus johnsonii]OYS06353.1 ADP-ribose pyrophosphatase [Lactobacillus johnsonii]OYS09406.1 ADP-ribose pyrophosphatase [Lactobacillus johnsonii]OYS11015.1 ADP-ribose pyrophosphatase [Lactobacillus johnsonii]OYS14009.1 ADP-ribose pyrophosphatase [Lactobacillus johnsonii]